MKIYILLDMEGISGVSSDEFTRRDGRNYQLGCQYMTDDANACVQACIEAGATDIIVRDAHGPGDNICWMNLPPEVRFVQGGTGGDFMWMLDGADAVILLGYHAMAGTLEAFLEHTISTSIQNFWLNGEKIGEFALCAAIAAERGVPTIMTSGDDKLCLEAKKWLPEIVTCQVKTACGCNSGLLIPREQAHKLIEEKTKEAISQISKIPLKKVSPATFRKEMVERVPAPIATGSVMIDARTSEFTALKVEDAYFYRNPLKQTRKTKL